MKFRDLSFVAHRRRAYKLSAGLFVLLLAITVVRGGFRLGLDFIGGTSVIVKFDRPFTTEELGRLREVLRPKGLGDNIRTIGEVGASKEEAREISIDVRGTGWVDEQVARFGELRSGGDPATIEAVRNHFSGVLADEALDDLIGNFVPASADTEAIALYDPKTVTDGDLAEIFQSLFNENTSSNVRHALEAAYPPEEGLKRADINALGDARAVAEVLAGLKAEAVAEQIAAFLPPTGPRPWSSVTAFLSEMNLSAFDGLEAREMLFLDDGSDTAALAPGAVSLATGEPAAIAKVLVPAFRRRFMNSAELIVEYRTRDHGGLFPNTAAAAAVVSATDPEVAGMLTRYFHAGRFIVASSETVGPTVGKALMKEAAKAIIFSLLGIILYVWVRFEFRFGVGGILALAHDALLTIAFIGAAGIEFSIPIVAALLTIIGYSINDTIVIYDRIREKMGNMKESPSPFLIDLAIHETMSRTIATSLTVLFAVVAFLSVGPLVIRDLNIVLSFGLVVGSYSTIFIASPFLLEWERWREKRRAAQKR